MQRPHARFPRLTRLGSTSLALLALMLAAPVWAASPPPAAPEGFATADDAATALATAARTHDQKTLHALFGAGSDNVIDSGDKYADQDSQRRFAESYDQKHQLVPEGDGRMVLQVGPDDWPLPIPLIQQDGKWRFDTQSGAEEIIDRRIGSNELKTIRGMLAYVQAQHDYFDLTKQQGGTGTYAQRLVSTKGKRDGLYWPTDSGEPDSPLGPLVDAALDEGYPGEIVSGKNIPYQGYDYRILKAQGSDAPGGAMSYVKDGKMTEGFALLAWPASYGVSGIMSFEVNQDGTVYQKDLGSRTSQVATIITRFDPDPSWAQIELSGAEGGAQEGGGSSPPSTP
jgi:Protein of unknown function (DUF2950)